MASPASPASPEKPKPDHKGTDPVLIALKRLQVAGTVVAVGALLTQPVLSLMGFSAIGPVAGSLAAGWQSSMGAGSLFAWCQSAAMDGTAATAVTGTGIGGGIVAAGATVSRYLRRKETGEADTPRSEDTDDDHDGHENDKGRDDDESGKGNQKN